MTILPIGMLTVPPEDENNGGDDLDSESHEVGAAYDLQHGQGHADEHQQTGGGGGGEDEVRRDEGREVGGQKVEQELVWKKCSVDLTMGSAMSSRVTRAMSYEPDMT